MASLLINPGLGTGTDSSTRYPPDFTNFLSCSRPARLLLVTKPDKRRDARAWQLLNPPFFTPPPPPPLSRHRRPSFLSFSSLPHLLPPSTRATQPRVKEREREGEGEGGSGCTEAIYFWHPFLLRLVHPFIICIRFCCRVPVGSVFVGPLEAHVSIFLVCHRRAASVDRERERLKIDEVTRQVDAKNFAWATRRFL